MFTKAGKTQIRFLDGFPPIYVSEVDGEILPAVLLFSDSGDSSAVKDTD